KFTLHRGTGEHTCSVYVEGWNFTCVGKGLFHKYAADKTQKDLPFLQRLSSFSNQVTVFLRVLFFSFSLSYFCFHCSAVSSMFTVTVFLMVFALDVEKKFHLKNSNN
uniref:Uncharacterized protein n=1 Tax=Stegastes partitus TaxID=144197 RepID=A0A3B5AH85_9TELE